MTFYPIIDLDYNLTDPDDSIPVRADYLTDIAAIGSLLSWHRMDADYVTKDRSNRVSALTDLSGNDNTFTQGTGGNQPLWLGATDNEVAPLLNTRPCVSFDSGRGDVMAWGGTFPTGDHTKVVVLRPDGAASSTQNILSDSATPGKHTLFRVALNDSIRSALDESPNAVDPQVDVTDDEWVLIISSFDASAGTAKISKNGGTIVSETDAFAAVERTALYLGGTSGGGQLNGQIADIMIFDADIHADATNLALIKAYIEGRYGLNLS